MTENNGWIRWTKEADLGRVQGQIDATLIDIEILKLTIFRDSPKSCLRESRIAGTLHR